MKVLQQLIQHFWLRGVLAVEQAHYLVESGFIRPGDLENYEPRLQEDEGDSIADRLPTEIYLPDELERTEEELSVRPVRRKGAKTTPKATDLTMAELEQQLRAVLAARSSSLPALVELSSHYQPCSDQRAAVVLLRQLDERTFSKVLLDGVRARAGLLAELWDGVDAEPFHLTAALTARGRVAGAFRVMLRAATPQDWAPAAWLLQVVEVQTITNLLAVRRRLLPGLVGLYDQHRSALARCLQRPARSLRSWRPLSYGFALLYNARAHVAHQRAPGYPLGKQLSWDEWREAWTVAMSLDAGAVTPYFIHVFGSLGLLQTNASLDLEGREDVELVCPTQWKL